METQFGAYNQTWTSLEKSNNGVGYKKNVYNRNVNLYQNENLHIFFQCGALPFINNDICRTKQQVFVSFCIVRAPGRYSKFASYERTN